VTVKALFCGDIAFDVALRVARHPDPDQKTPAFEERPSTTASSPASAPYAARRSCPARGGRPARAGERPGDGHPASAGRERVRLR
jgi:hypothetical protein